MANSQIMLRLECDTSLDSVSANGVSRGLMLTQDGPVGGEFRQVRLSVG